ncbi:uncharacterized protein LACBIDRAFT_313377 [Laccaria bicolor S238N-H82]|uniref:Predicted protein n=1 Tax=Laccaria bicolor (strain S238N-H82 / ATCC MYA-4686) TaxID=486041 RepID=B0DY70_LACBS|nr:uncharacterized protein LACBIDRAFT_313377 [Laccaria bicolor S238N-H82]EDR00510.1 predicted protein [Laccaria bicolor S238N-H82]|eukprot:XP_001888902.1 predicted protein [Laccaria bicolor S238N-H82]
MSLSSLTKVVFPPPPPTTNSLTAPQRAQLLRRTRKLEKILGTAPHLVDTSVINDPLYISLPSKKRSSIDSMASGSSSSSASSTLRSSSIGRRASTSSTTMPASLKSDSLRSRRSSSPPTPNNKPPFLRLAISPPALDTIPASPAALDASPCTFYDLQDTHTISPVEVSPRDSPVLPSFSIPSPSTTRRRKMDRVRRKLGEGVPIGLVFPPEETLPSTPSQDSIPKFPTPPPTPRPRKSSAIEASRDSIAESSSVHRAGRRSAKRSSTTPPSSKSAPWSPSDSYSTEKLSAIIESPDEHGASCSEEFGRRSMSSGERNLPQKWFGHTDEVKVKIWSTRKGYCGWQEGPPVPVKDESSRDSKRRSLSYRKPPPSMIEH